ncbi:MAG: hypothetical protein CMP23_02740 [Rickettsiales bacterium]|nr:hypothetical protein [Rickettsiales bacterium]
MISLMGENEASQTPSQADLRRWADDYGITHPVLADPNFGVTARFLSSNVIQMPTGHLLTTGAEVVVRDSWPSSAELNGALP